MTKEQLKQERKALGKTQEEMALHLGTKTSTYRNWEQGVSPVPGSVVALLTPRETDVPLTFEDLRALEEIAQRRNDGSSPMSLMKEFIKAGIKAGLSLALLLAFGNQLLHPEDGMARRFGGRRKQEGSGAFVVDCDAEA